MERTAEYVRGQGRLIGGVNISLVIAALHIASSLLNMGNTILV